MNADILNKDWVLFKKVLDSSVAGGNTEESYRLLELICRYAYAYNFLKDFKDDQLEDSLYRLTGQISRQFEFKPPVSSKTEKVIFYDFFTLDFRGFTQQYIDYFIKHEIEFLYIMYDRNYSEKKQIIQSINNYPGGSILIIETKKTSQINNLPAVYEAINNYRAGKIFIHNAPWDIFSYCLCILLKGGGTESFLIDITDYTFWLGSTVFDYIINFRKYGARLNHFYRQIPLNKLLIINTPAYIDNNIPFKGFPVTVAGKVVGFGGGSIYKIKDESNTYLNLIKSLLQQNNDFIFFFANVGDKDYVNDFVKQNDLKDKLIPIGNREDICAIFQHIDIYFNTYPYGGGNMVSYGFQHKVPVVSMYNKNYLYARLDVVFDIEIDGEFIVEEESSFFKYSTRLIRSAEYRREVADLFFNKINNKRSFETALGSLLHDELAEISVNSLKSINIDNDSIVAFHLQDNQFQKTEYSGLKAAILRNHFFDEFKIGWTSRFYWKHSFQLSVKEQLKKYFPVLQKLKNPVNG